MSFKGKTNDYWKETLGGPLCGCIACALLLFISPPTKIFENMYSSFPAIGMCIFGFLLTILSIILQGDGSAIKWLKSRHTIFNRFVNFNKRVVILSFSLSIVSFFIGNTPLNTHCFYGPWGGMFTWMMVDIAIFINLFYKLIQNRNDLQ